MCNYKNQYFSVFGDSISTLFGYIPQDYESFYTFETCYKANVFAVTDTWWGQVIDTLGGQLLLNNSWSGSMVCKHRLCEIPSYGASDERTSNLGKDGIAPDVIMVYLGTNDWGAGMKLCPDEGEEKDLSVFQVAYSTMLDKIRKNYPAAEIWCFTLGVSSCSANPDFVFPNCYAGKRIENYCGIIIDCAKKYHCRVINLYQATTNIPFDTIDGFHPNLEGMKTIASAVLHEIQEHNDLTEG